jgi:hypothetical protein
MGSIMGSIIGSIRGVTLIDVISPYLRKSAEKICGNLREKVRYVQCCQERSLLITPTIV